MLAHAIARGKKEGLVGVMPGVIDVMHQRGALCCPCPIDAVAFGAVGGEGLFALLGQRREVWNGYADLRGVAGWFNQFRDADRQGRG